MTSLKQNQTFFKALYKAAFTYIKHLSYICYTYGVAIGFSTIIREVANTYSCISNFTWPLNLMLTQRNVRYGRVCVA